MTPEQTQAVLTKCAAYDQRTVGRADVMAWHEALGDLDLADCLTAVARYYRDNRERIWPADIRQQVLAIRNARAQAQPHPVRELPSRFEADQIRDRRVREGVARLAAAVALPAADPGSDPHAAALARARRERGKRGAAALAPRQRHRAAKPLDLAKIPGPEWSKPEVRERAAVAELHRLGRPCGREVCPKCRKEPAAA